MSSSFGERLIIQIFGESHGPALGAVMNNLPPGQLIDESALAQFMQRRAPGQQEFSSSRTEPDLVEILSGLYQGRTTGTPLSLIIKNQDQRSADYAELRATPRPGHADLTGLARYYGANDPRGGGHFSGRLTAPLSAAGNIAMQILQTQKIFIYAQIKEIAGIKAQTIDPLKPEQEQLAQIANLTFPCLDETAATKMQEAIREAKAAGDSVGGAIEVCVLGYPAGLGDPIFGGLKARLASMIYALPAVKVLSFGLGKKQISLRGSEVNDSPQFLTKGENTVIRYTSNNAGGIEGGISTGMPILLQVGIKPTPSIAKEQATIDLAKQLNTTIQISGRHDPCIVPRMVPVLEAATALVLLDCLLASGEFVGE